VDARARPAHAMVGSIWVSKRIQGWIFLFWVGARGVPTIAKRRSRRPVDLPRQPASSIVYIGFDYFKSSTLQDASLIPALSTGLGKSALCRERTHALHKRGVLVGYSITLSARASSVGGTSRPSAFAV
jgi:hypothetical protein